MSRHDWGDVLGLLFILAVVMILTRPTSQAPVMIGSLGDAFAAIIGFATDSGASVGSAAGSSLGNLG